LFGKHVDNFFHCGVQVKVDDFEVELASFNLREIEISLMIPNNDPHSP
jgi:hypothetical protein